MRFFEEQMAKHCIKKPIKIQVKPKARNEEIASKNEKKERDRQTTERA